MVTLEKATKKQIILEAAAKLFRDRGYSATSMRDLAREVRLNPSSLYNHIDSKEDMLQEICFRNAHRFMQGISEIEQLSISNLEKIKALLCLHVEVATSDITSITSFNDEWRHLEEPHLSQFLYLRRDYEKRFLSIIQAGINEGEIKNINPQVLFFTILSSVRWLYDWVKKEHDFSCQALQNQFCEMLLDGVRN